MTYNSFVNSYNKVIERAMECSEKARCEGLLALEDIIDKEKVKDRDIFEYGLHFVIMGTAYDMIDKILSNIIEQEKDKYARRLKMIQKEAALKIQEGLNPSMIYALLNSYSPITIGEDKNNCLI
jgi:flagellar motor component MotA